MKPLKTMSAAAALIALMTATPVHAGDVHKRNEALMDAMGLDQSQRHKLLQAAQDANECEKQDNRPHTPLIEKMGDLVECVEKRRRARAAGTDGRLPEEYHGAWCYNGGGNQYIRCDSIRPPPPLRGERSPRRVLLVKSQAIFVINKEGEHEAGEYACASRSITARSGGFNTQWHCYAKHDGLEHDESNHLRLVGTVLTLEKPQ
jgi:hypothetical protein